MPKKNWTSESIANMKKYLKLEFDAYTNPSERLNAILNRIDELESSLGADTQLELVILCISALAHHATKGGLQGPHVNSLTKLTQSLLALNGIKPKSGNLSVVYGDLFLARGTIKLREGNQESAMWEQLVAFELSGEATPGGKSYQLLTIGLRYARQGFNSEAIDILTQAAAGLSGVQRVFAELNLLKCLRLSGDKQNFQIQYSACNDLDLSPKQKSEALWENICYEAMQASDISLIISSVLKGGTHYNEPTYLLEALLWAWTDEDEKLAQKLPKISYLDRGRKFKPKDFGEFYEACRVINRCHDLDGELSAKIFQLGQFFEMRSKLPSIDKELLFLAASHHWLFKNELFYLASAVESYYKNLSLSLTAFRSDDLFGILPPRSEAAAANKKAV